jgi:hypothetical protein
MNSEASNCAHTLGVERRRAAPYDRVLLPLFAILAVSGITLLLAAVGLRFSASKTSTLPCLILSADQPVRGNPGAVCWSRERESPLVQYRFNNFGYRSDFDYGPRVAGVRRIVLLGSSIVEGYAVNYKETFAAHLPRLLTEATGRKWEVYNDAMQWGTPASVVRRLPDALASKPDLIVWPITPWDVENVSLVMPSWFLPGNQPVVAGLMQRIRMGFRRESLIQLVKSQWQRHVDALTQTGAIFMLQHYLYMNQQQYIQDYLRSDSAGFLRRSLSEDWAAKLQTLDHIIASVSAQCRAAGIPLVLTLVPQRAQAALLSDGAWPADVDPYRLGSEIQSLAATHGAEYIDILHKFAQLSHPERLYYPVDGHLDADGQGVLARSLAQQLIAIKGSSSSPFIGRQNLEYLEHP